ncbi:hypothetical protein H6P81_004064 [Aristolochia fimbriata]|uniref:PHD and RING finger domain-containing protein 1 n=1 Tax=Aristolochia fimbriata TaxID=158543 RepID=A0AAV7FHH3_ARIFI|nr:hypothetical protein H6P81_004064 [Aristolochia fimbriata]
MGRGGKMVRQNRGRKTRIGSKQNDSDGSDEDYVVGEEECDDGSQESSDASSLVASDALEESFDFGDENSCSSLERPKLVKSKSRRRISVRSKPAVRRPIKRKKSCRVLDDEEEDYDTDDDEFVPEVDDFLDEDEQSGSYAKKNRMVGKKGPVKSQKRKKKPKLAKKASKSQGRLALRRVVSSDDDFLVKESAAPKRVKKQTKRRKKTVVPRSDSDLEDSESSDYEYTISEEEREVIREAQESVNLTNCLRNSSVSTRLQVDGVSNWRQMRSPERKGKEKVVDPQVDGKQVCGICLSEERIGVVRGTLNCCFHYFCFTCIMEWSKVESRCPLCKQRFVTISKEARSDIGIGLRKSVIKVPRRDQVYRPSEEEIMTYLNPYENVLCIECQQGGDDELMLLCDICDSSAHTYCVGLGREVPEGNWYCEACKSSGFESNTSAASVPIPDQPSSTSGLLNETTVRGNGIEGLDLNLPYDGNILDQPEEHNENDVLSSTRNLVREALDVAHNALPVHVAGPSTVSGRRRLRFRIHNLLSSNRLMRNAETQNGSVEDGQVKLGTEYKRVVEDGDPNCATVENGTLVRSSSLSKNMSCTSGNREPFCAGTNYLGREENWGACITSSEGPCSEILPAEADRVGSSYVSGHEHIRPVTRLNDIAASDNGRRCGPVTTEDAKQQVRTMVKRHLTLISRDTHLESATFKEIARYSTHTILAACGVDHNENMAFCVNPPTNCFHPVEEGDRIKILTVACCSRCFDDFVKDIILRLSRIKLQSST